MRQIEADTQQQLVTEQVYVIDHNAQLWHIGTTYERALCGYWPFAGWLMVTAHAPRTRGICSTSEQGATR